MWVIDWVRTLIYAVAGWVGEHGDTVELRVTPGEHHYVEAFEQAVSFVEPNLVDWETSVEEVLHDLGLV